MSLSDDEYQKAAAKIGISVPALRAFAADV